MSDPIKTFQMPDFDKIKSPSFPPIKLEVFEETKEKFKILESDWRGPIRAYFVDAEILREDAILFALEKTLKIRGYKLVKIEGSSTSD